MKILNESQAQQISNMAVSRLANHIRESEIRCLVVGISGGIDSADIAVIAIRAVNLLKAFGYQINTHFSFLDVESNEHDCVKANLLANYLSFELKNYDFTEWYQDCPFLEELSDDPIKAKIEKGNVKCRIRMMALMHFAHMNNGIYLDTDDLSEWYMGFWTRHGDEGDLKLIQHLTKDEVYDLGEFYGVPEEILKDAPGDGLGVTKGSLASDQLGMSYLKIDYVISRFLENGYDHNGSYKQILNKKFDDLLKLVSNEIGEPEEITIKCLRQMARTTFKRKYGENVADLLPDRLEMGLPQIGTPEFNAVYLKAIEAS